ncbi:MAG: tetraacyldisaccharide 4'-kinase [Desulfurivibrionaceae bacterium]|nr:tetraacyldisaccharide 4'-kinase [Desulfobulbales bacterium]MDT8335511.1 tetraacyldisaccharide 4'-kinase [Desulfurivibrionaceae bacterium]
MRKKTRQRLAFLLGRPFSPLYGALMRKRAAWYRSGVMASSALPVPVISIGNLTMGGTGKTPMTIYVADRLQGAGYRPAIISRGYGGKARQAVNLVSDGARCLLDAGQAGDEPRLMAENLPGVIVATGVNRAAAADFAVRELGADIIVLDDGFQHLGLRRDLDLVLFKAPVFMGNGRVFPGGDLREPVDALARADGFVVTGVDRRNRAAADEFKSFLERDFPGRPVFMAEYRLKSLTDRQGAVAGPEVFDQKLYGFCGLAEPGGFLLTVSDQGISLYGFSVFADHHPYSGADLAALVEDAGRYGCDGLLTSEKDMVKLKGLSCPLPIYSLNVELRMPPSFDDFLLSGMAGRGLASVPNPMNVSFPPLE